jgi:hypothetical protein
MVRLCRYRLQLKSSQELAVNRALAGCRGVGWRESFEGLKSCKDALRTVSARN